MKQVKFWLKFLSLFATRFRSYILLSTLLGVILFVVLPRLGILSFFQKPYTVGLVGRYTAENLPFSIQSQISQGLTAQAEDGSVLPGLASSWEAQEEGKVWVFKLKESRWQDGKPVLAQDINYNFEDVQIQVLGEKTLKMTLKDPFAPLPSVVAKPVFKKGFLGAGEWKVTKLSLLGNQIVEAIELTKIATGEKKSYRFYPTEETARTAIMLGEVDELAQLVDPEELVSWPNLKIQGDVRADRYAAVFFNSEDPVLTEKNVRQGLAYAINKERFGDSRALGPISPLSWAYNPQVKPYLYNTQRAKELLGKNPIEVNLVTTPTLLSLADEIKADWEAAGVKTNIQVSNTPPSDFQALLAIQITPPDPDQYGFWHSTQTLTNVTRYHGGDQKGQRESPRIDKLLEDGRRTLDQEERKKIYVDFQRFLVEDSPAIFLFHPTTYTITRK